MDFLQLAEERFSVRSFADKEIEQEKIDAILRAGQSSCYGISIGGCKAVSRSFQYQATIRNGFL